MKKHAYDVQVRKPLFPADPAQSNLTAQDIVDIAREVGLDQSQIESALTGAHRRDVTIIAATSSGSQDAITREFQHFMHDNYFAHVSSSAADGQWWQPAQGSWAWTLRTFTTGARPALGTLKGIGFRSVQRGQTVEFALALVERRRPRLSKTWRMLAWVALAGTLVSVVANVAKPEVTAATLGAASLLVGLFWRRLTRARPTAHLACERWVMERTKASPKALPSSLETHHR